MKQLSLGLGALIASTSMTNATVLVYEGFDYNVANLPGQGGWTSSGSGDTNRLTVVGNSMWTTTDNADFNTAALANNRARFDPNQTVNRLAQQTIALAAGAPSVGGDLWGSFLYTPGSAKHENAGLRLRDPDLGGNQVVIGMDARAGSVGSNTNSDKSNVFLSGTTTVTAAGAETTGVRSGTMGVFNISNYGTASAEYTFWRINLADYNTIFAGSSYLSDLNANNQYSTSTTGNSVAFDGDEYWELYYSENYTVNINNEWDEIRLGTTLESVLVIAVPEPSSAALIGLGGLALILRRRK